MLPILHIYGLTIQTPLLAIMVGYIAGLNVSGRLAERHGLDGQAISDAGFYGFFAAAIGARIGYVLLNLSVFAREPLSALMPSTTALDAISGWLTGIACAVLILRRKKMLRVETLDVIAPGALIFLMGLALGDFLSGDNIGAVAQLPWSIYMWDTWRHPVQFYELAGLTFILIVCLRILQTDKPHGTAMLVAVGLYAAIRVFVDAFKADAYLFAGVRLSQLVGITISVGAFWSLGQLLYRNTRNVLINEASEKE
jgi:phosphatidylglycerol:prolipoprotein diacylglycerol transferase